MLHVALVVFLILLQRLVLVTPPLSASLCFLLRLAAMTGRTLFAYELVLRLRHGRDLPAIFIRLTSAAVLTELLSYLLRDRLQPLAMVTRDDMFSFAAAFALVAGIGLITRSMPDLLMMLRPVTAGCRENCSPPLFQLRVNLGGITMPAWQGVLLGCGSILASLTAAYLLQPPDAFQTLALAAALDFIVGRLGPWNAHHNRELRRSWLLQMLITLALLSLLFVFIDLGCGIRSPLSLISRAGTLPAVLLLVWSRHQAPSEKTQAPPRLWVAIYVLVRLLGMLTIAV